MTNHHEVGVAPIHDGVLKGKRPPLRLRSYFSTKEWEQFRYEIYEAMLPAIQFQRTVLLALVGFFLMPILSFASLLILLKCDFLILADDQEEEVAFQLILVVATCGSLGLGFGCLVLGSFVRSFCIESFVDANLARVVCVFLESRARGKDLIIDIQYAPRSTCISYLRRIFLAWCDVEYVLVVSLDDFGSYEFLEDVTEESSYLTN
jgi:hypothetical protein